jgi:intein/homing endonuclease
MGHDDRIKEIIKCGSDPVYYIEKYVKIQHPIKGLIDFNLFDYQKKCLQEFNEYKFNITLKSRQLGISTLAAAYSVWLAIFYREKNILVIATKLKTAQNFIKKVKVAIEYTPEWLRLPEISSITRTEVEFDNGSIIKAIPTSPDAGRSEALSFLIVDEAAFIRDFEEIWTGLYPTLSCLTADTKVITPNGYCKIGDLCKGKVGDYIELDRDELLVYGKNGFEPVSHTYISPKSVVKKITTESGKIIRCTENHPLWALSGKFNLSMIKAKDLKKHYYLKVIHNQNVFGNIDNLNLLDIYAFGSVLNNGWCEILNNRRTVIKTAVDTTICINTLKRHMFYSCFDGSLKLLNRKLINKYFDWGFDPDKKMSDREVPNIVWKFNKKLQVVFLRGVFDSDPLNKKFGGVSICSVSEQFLQDIQLLLSNLGILSKIEKHLGLRPIHNNVYIDYNEFYKDYNEYWKLDIQPTNNNLDKFEELIGYVNNKDVDNIIRFKLKFDYNLNDKKLPRIIISTLKAKIYGIQNKINRICKNIYALKAVNRARIYNIDTKPKLKNFLSNCNSVLGDEYNFILGEFVEDDVTWERIISIEDDELVETYDFTVPGTHTFLQNGILGSNTGGRSLIISTPNGTSGIGGQYYRLWSEAISKNNDFNPIKLEWYVHPEHDDIWFEEQKRQLGNPAKINQELLCNFYSSTNTFLQPDDINWLNTQIFDPLKKVGNNGSIWVWRDAIEGRKYIISSDVSRGDADDYSTFHIIDYENCEVVAEFMDKIPPDSLGLLLFDWGKKYNNALIAVEQNTYGYMTNMKLKELGYPYLYYKDCKKNNLWNYVASETEIPGFITTSSSRPSILSKLEELIRNKIVKIYSERFYEQINNFIWSDGKPQASGKGANDDLVISLSIGCWLSKGIAAGTVDQSELTKVLLKATSKGNPATDILNKINHVRPPQYSNMISTNQINPISDKNNIKPIINVNHNFDWLLK